MTAVKTDLKAADIMIREPVCVEPTTTLQQLARILEENDISGAPVVNKNGQVIGVVSKTDVMKRCTEGTVDVPPAFLFEVLYEQGDAESDLAPATPVCVEDFMTEDPVTVTPDTPLGEVAGLMVEGRFHRVLVIDGGRFPVGIITSMDLLATYPR